MTDYLGLDRQGALVFNGYVAPRRNSGQLRRFAMQHCCHWHVTAVRCRQANFFLLVAAARTRASAAAKRYVPHVRARTGAGVRGDTRVRTCGKGNPKIPTSFKQSSIALNSINKINTFIARHIINSSQA